MAADSTTDDTKENTQSGDADAITGSSNDTPFTDLDVDKQPSQVDSKDIPSSQSKDTGKENATSLHLGLEAMKDEEEMFPRCDKGDNSAAISMEEPDKLDISSIDIQSNGRGDGTGEKAFTQSPAAAPALAAESNVQKLDGTDLNDPNQHDSFIPEERSLEVKAKHEKSQQQKDGVLGAEEGRLMSVLKESGSFANNETKEKFFCKEIPGLELATENVTNKKLVEVEQTHEVEEEFVSPEQNALPEAEMKTAVNMFLQDKNADLENESETEENQAAFMKELEAFHKERCLEFKPPKFYGEPLNCLKLWRAVIKLGGYEQVTACKLWRQVGESFSPPKTCTTVSWTFRGFYEKALLEYEKHKMRSGELPFTDASFVESSGTGTQAGLSQASGSGRARRDAAARAMQGWHTQRVLGSGEVGDPIIKDKTSVSTPKREKQLKTVGLLKRKKLSPVDHSLQVAHLKASKPQLETMVVDIGPQADWVKINVQRTKDCFEVYALVPGLLREEVRVQSDPAGRLVISGQPEQLDNPWGVTPFKKVVSLPSRIDPHQTSAVVTLHGQLFVRVPFEQSQM